MPKLSFKSLGRPGVRAAAHNFGWLLAERGTRLVFTVLVGFWVARYLGPEDFGSLSYALAVVAIGLALAECGVGNIVRREIVGNPERAASVLVAARMLRLLAGGVCYLSLLLWSILADTNSEERLLLGLLGLLLFQPALSVSDLWLQARLDAKTSTLAQMVALIAGAVVRVCLILESMPVWTFAAAAATEGALAALLLNRFAHSRGRPRFEQPSMAILRRLWSESWPLMVSGLTVIIYIRIDVVMLRQIVGEAAAGVYSAAVRVSELWFFLPGAVMSSLLPAVMRAKAAGKSSYHSAIQRALDANVGLAYLIAIPTVLCAHWIVVLAYGHAYEAGAGVLAVHGWTLIFTAIGVVRGQYCVNEGLTRLHLASTAAGALMNVALNIVLIPRYGGVGAAWATLATQAVAAYFSSFCFAATRDCAKMQTRALLIPLRLFEYVR